ncbi:MAG TPA: SUMF1/EgtB/PvdO family nonheme iron enzyme [Pirellulales bacterium]|nr:SUMF1/EgtB/PvdO family nonheme iron enzyme [Pirellulales bacterium]
MRRTVAACWGVLAVLLTGSGKPLPDEESLAAAKRAAAQKYQRTIATSDARTAAQGLLKASDQTEAEAEQAAILLVAADVAAKGGEVRLAFQAIDELEGTFEIDALPLKAACLESAARSARTNEIRTAVVHWSIDLMREATAARQFEAAQTAAKAGQSALAKVRDAALRKEFGSQRRLFELQRKTYETAGKTVADAVAALAKQPDDPAANEVMGKHLAATEGDWPKVLVHFAKAGDAELRAAAEREAKAADKDGPRVELADLWWNIADGVDLPEYRVAFRSRAVYWYRRALPALTGLVKMRATKRIEEAEGGAVRGKAADAADKLVEIPLSPTASLRLVVIPPSADGGVKRFWLGQTEVTQQQWLALMPLNPSVQTRSDRLPVHGIGPQDAAAFCEKLNTLKTRFIFRLPTKEEWFHALEAGDRDAAAKLDWPASNDYAWSKENAGGSYDFHPVGDKKPNRWGLFDMLGNCWEWCADGKDYGMCSFDDFSRRQVDQYIVRREPYPNVQRQHWGGISLRVAADLR